MELTNEFSVKAPVHEAWAVLTDLERVAPCMPGFELQEVDGEEYRGVVRVKVGPMAARYRGVASFRERDEANHRAVVHAEGRETRGQGNAAATVTATLVPEDGGTRVRLHTDLKITGRVAQFGRGVLADVSRKLLAEFVQALEADVLRGAGKAGTGAAGAAAVGEAAANGGAQAAPEETRDDSAGARRLDPVAGKPVDLLATAGSSLVKRVLPLAVALVAVLWLLGRCP